MRTFFRRLLESRYRISTQLYSGIWGAVALTVAAGLVGWFSFNQVGEAQSVVNENTVPELATAFEIAQYSSTLVDAAPNLTTAATPEELDEIAAGIEETSGAFLDQLDLMEESQADAQQFEQLRYYVDSLIANIAAISRAEQELQRLAVVSGQLRTELDDLGSQLDLVVIPALDDQFFFGMTGYRSLWELPIPRDEYLTEEQLVIYRHLSEIQANTNIATQLVATAFSVSDASQVEPLRESFEAAQGQIETSLIVLEGADFHEELSQLFAQLFERSLGTEGAFNLATQQLRFLDNQVDLLSDNRLIAVDLLGEVNLLVSAARGRADEATQASDQAILTGRTLLLAISILSVTGAVLMAWLFVGRVLLRRLNQLSDWMLGMADGDLETRIEIKGRDEVADMAAALEVFRINALEVQRLNLVEKLANELEEKNADLERVLDDLQKAQEQIVIQEKLAALGELTAGVAHEIRNPLNFVKNFAESSEELLEEMQEIFDDIEDDIEDDDMDYIQEIKGDLVANLGRIRSHGNRANSIVEDMLMMGRDSGEKRMANLNNVVHEHMKLAYHSARALDPDFNLTINEEYDPNVGELKVVPQDIGRVFLNLVSNACYATDERRKKIEATGEKGFMPELRVTTHREEDRIVVKVWDNGGGIPDDVVEKIFNPFFTTKPTDKGTGLGLALSSDIARQHGGLIRVETMPGEATTMIVEIPLDDNPIREVAGIEHH
ncbi:MAG: HAMP domain-containing protein [Actinomycetia bacterium]|nr:HAMP domain-containing protein [Actinomycetes bacterium]